MPEEKLNGAKTLRGRIKYILPVYSTPTFSKLEFILLTDEAHPQTLKFELHNTRITLLTGFIVGDEIELTFNLRGREWVDPKGKTIYFLSFVAWKINKINNGYIVPTAEKSNHIQHNYNFPPASEVFADDEADDLPF